MLLAYLDPGSGSALVGTLIAVAGAALYSLKSFFYRLIRRNDPKSPCLCASVLNNPPPIAIFSEGRNYWGTFKLIVDELISRRIHFAYYTLDLHDPALLIDNPYMHARLYDKRKPSSYHHLSNLKADVLLATSPNIGTPGFPIKRSPDVKNLVHVFHAFADISAYHAGSLDSYNTVLMVGPHQSKPIQEVEKARNLSPKKLIPIGLPYFDAQYLALNSTVGASEAKSERRDTAYPPRDPEEELRSRAPTLLIGPSWGAKGLLKEYGTDFIFDLAKAGYNIIIRPHPQSYIAEPEFISQCQAETAAYSNIVWDSEVVGTKSMLASALLISDTSSLRFDYAFLYAKPVITLDIPHEKQLEYEGQFMTSIWTDVVADKLGKVLNHSTLPTITEEVKKLLSSTSTLNLDYLRSSTITNLGSSHKAIVDYLTKEVA